MSKHDNRFQNRGPAMVGSVSAELTNPATSTAAPTSPINEADLPAETDAPSSPVDFSESSFQPVDDTPALPGTSFSPQDTVVDDTASFTPVEPQGSVEQEVIPPAGVEAMANVGYTSDEPAASGEVASVYDAGYDHSANAVSTETASVYEGNDANAQIVAPGFREHLSSAIYRAAMSLNISKAVAMQLGIKVLADEHVARVTDSR